MTEFPADASALDIAAWIAHQHLELRRRRALRALRRLGDTAFLLIVIAGLAGSVAAFLV